MHYCPFVGLSLSQPTHPFTNPGHSLIRYTHTLDLNVLRPIHVYKYIHRTLCKHRSGIIKGVGQSSFQRNKRHVTGD